MLMFLDRTKCR